MAGCQLTVKAAAQMVWPQPYLPEDWRAQLKQGFSPQMAWLDKLVDFTQSMVRHYYPDQCFPTVDLLGRGPGDLLVQILGAESTYYSFYKHATEVKLLLEQLTDLHLAWANAQLSAPPRIEGGYCTQYGLWVPGSFVRYQEDFAVNLSDEMFNEFIAPCSLEILAAFDHPIVPTDSGFSPLAEWALGVDRVKAIDVTLDPNGPEVETLVPLRNRILEKKVLILSGPLTQAQLDFLISRLRPGGLVFDLDLQSEERLPIDFPDVTPVGASAL